MKKIIFISHIHEEKELAIKLKNLIEEAFLGMIDIFVSSDENSISLGKKWLENISNSLKNCSLEILLCSPISIKRPWLNFEAGAGWVREIDVIPLCHSGLNPENLPIPLNLLEAAKLNENNAIKSLFFSISKILDSKIPNIDINSFNSYIIEFEKKYIFWNKLNECFDKLNIIDSKIVPALRINYQVKLHFNETDINNHKDVFDFFLENKLFEFENTGNAQLTDKGLLYECNIYPLIGNEFIWSNDNNNYKI